MLIKNFIMVMRRLDKIYENNVSTNIKDNQHQKSKKVVTFSDEQNIVKDKTSTKSK